jgi:hypothetical protein
MPVRVVCAVVGQTLPGAAMWSFPAVGWFGRVVGKRPGVLVSGRLSGQAPGSVVSGESEVE